MKKVADVESFEASLEACQECPIMVERDGVVQAVIISAEAYEYFLELEDGMMQLTEQFLVKTAKDKKVAPKAKKKAVAKKPQAKKAVKKVVKAKAKPAAKKAKAKKKR